MSISLLSKSIMILTGTSFISGLIIMYVPSGTGSPDSIALFIMVV
jgi:hypothetical protein